MRLVLMADHDKSMYEDVERALLDSYKISPLLPDADLEQELSERKIDLLLLTVSEEHNGWLSWYEQRKELLDTADFPVVFLAGCGCEWIEEKVLAAGARDLILRPASAAMLRNKIEDVLELHNLRKNSRYVEKYQDAIAFSFAELVDYRDGTTGDHLKNSTRYFHILLEEAIARGYYKELLKPEDIRDLLRSAALHDIGKIGINDDILRKASPLDHDEYAYMKTHTTLGMQAFEKMIRETGGTRWMYLARDIAYCHHEYWDGTGYPNGLKGEEIPVYARIMTVADVYDALTSWRSYKEAYPHEQAVQIMLQESGHVFDPKLVELFLSVQERFREALLRKE
ncbi:putative two-component system response regulator [Anaerotaenia torta]|uniref:HD domain-containing protein n=1 Tax=Anaerotaenia torta TaxID=433293 RepID=UPI003D1FAC9E